MKKLFTKQKGLITIEIEQEVYGLFHAAENQWVFVNAKGDEISYRRPSCAEEKEQEQADFQNIFSNDPTAIMEIGESMYSFSTHEVRYYPVEGYVGLMGIKDQTGKIVVDEKYESIDCFSNGYCSVKEPGGLVGCIDKAGKTVISFKYHEFIRFNKYGVAAADNCLIDLSEKPLENTELNTIGSCSENNRFFSFGLANEQQQWEIEQTGTAEDLKESIYDTKDKRFVVKDIPDSRLFVLSSICEPEVIVAAAKLLNEYDQVSVKERGTILATKGELTTVFDFYL